MTPGYDATTRLVARALALDAARLGAALRPATLADLDTIVAFRAAHLGAAIRWDDAAYLAWRYRLGRERAGFTELWLLQPGDAPLAMLGVEALPFILDGQRLDGARVMDLLARADVQGTGVGAWLNLATFRRHAFALAMGANENSAGIVKRLFQPLPERQTYTHPIDCRPFLRRSVDNAAAGALAGLAGNAAMSAWRTWRRMARPSSLRIEPITRFAADDVPPPAAAPGQLRLLRSAEHLNRRLFDNPRRRYQAIVVRRGEQTLGHLAWLLDEHSGERPELVLSDWQAASERTLGALLVAAIEHARRTGCSCVRMALQDDSTRRVAKRHGFLRLRQGSSQVVGVHAEDAALQARLVSADWALTDISDDLDGF